MRGEEAVVSLVNVLEAARKNGASETSLEAALKLHRKAQWRLDFVAAENSMGFHAPGETARLLAEAIDYARQGEAAVLRLSVK